jgi:hypothetical protein
MPKWIHDRAEHIKAKNPSMNESTAFAIATQQAHATSKAPKNYGTAEGRSEAKNKYDTPRDDNKTADPGEFSKESGLLHFLRPGRVSPIDQYTREIVREEIAKAQSNKPAKMESPIKDKIKMAGISSVLSLIDGFSDELQKIANMPPISGAPTTVNQVQGMVPKNTLKNNTPKYTQINAGMGGSPVQSHQPVLSPPPVRG